MINPYVFIVGCQRSGTTLLKRMLNAHSQLTVTSEANWITRLFEKRMGITTESLVKPELLSFLLEDPAFTRLNVVREELETLIGDGQQVAYSKFISHIFDLCGEARGQALVGNKTPAHGRRLQTLHMLWPQARVIHLVRDGRDVCLSIAKWSAAHRKKPGTLSTWQNDPVTTTAFWWELHVQLGQQARAWLGAVLYEIRYESLVEHPAKESAVLCRFLGLPFDQALLSFYEGRTRNGPNLKSQQRALPATVILIPQARGDFSCIWMPEGAMCVHL